MTYITKQRSVDLTFAVASQGEGLGPAVYITTKRLTAFRRARNKGTHRSIIDKILIERRRRKEPGKEEGLAADDLDEGLKRKVIAGEPASPERAKVRRQCKPYGPIGLLLESIHMNTAVLDEELQIQHTTKHRSKC